jgi:hypothetical protein
MMKACLEGPARIQQSGIAESGNRRNCRENSGNTPHRTIVNHRLSFQCAVTLRNKTFEVKV